MYETTSTITVSGTGMRPLNALPDVAGICVGAKNEEDIRTIFSMVDRNEGDIRTIFNMITVINASIDTLLKTLGTACDLLADLYDRDRIDKGVGIEGIRAFIESIAVTEGIR